jgi:hypothetical protein
MGVTMTDKTNPSAETRAAEREEAGAAHDADRAPTPEEEQAAAKNSLDPEVAEHEKEMAERGVNQQGEGRIP